MQNVDHSYLPQPQVDHDILMIQGMAFNTFHQLIARNNIHTPVQTNEVSIYNENSMKSHVTFIWEAAKSCSEI